MLLFLKKIFALVIFILLLAQSSVFIVNAANRADKSLLPINITSSTNSINLKALTDDNISTVWHWKKGCSLKIKSTEKVGAIYIVWDRTPVHWSLNLPISPPTTTTHSASTTTHSSASSATSQTSSTETEQTTSTETEQTTNTSQTSSTTQTTIDAAGQLYEIDALQATAPKANKQNEINTIIKCGLNGFLHEYVNFPESVHSFTMHLENKDGMIANIYAFKKGKVPSWVQKWQPMLEKADMLVYSAHADDEHLWFGGTLPVYAGEYKKKVQVAYLIRHGAARNEYIRNHELLDGLWKVGVRNYPMISKFEDYYANSIKHALSIYNEDDVLKYTVMLLRRFKPDVVVSHDPKGEYGHGVHSLCSYILQKAIHLSYNPSHYPDLASKFGVWKIKKCYLHLYHKNKIEMDWNVPLTAFGGKTGLTMAREGYKCHTSQQNKWFSVQGKGSAYNCQSFGLYYTTVGGDIHKNDFFENISPVIPITTTHSTTTSTTLLTTQTASATVVSSMTSILSPTSSYMNSATPTMPAGGSTGNVNKMHRLLLLIACLKTILIAILTSAIVLYLRTHLTGLSGKI
ncbi:MAG: PIG-L family deacetylase [Oscillospiraceae bacterium]|nr:PIG-L family deacetylase [Oscillospiraceae bacterium]